MALYEYEAKNSLGKTVKGKMEGTDQNAVSLAIRQNGMYTVSIRKAGAAGMNMNINIGNGVKVKDIALFCRQFSFITSAGINILQALELLSVQTENKRLKTIIVEMSENVQKGISLSVAMSKYKEFPQMFIHMVEVAEASGTLDSVMIKMADYYEKEFKMHQKIKAALTYPIVLIVFGLIVVIFLVVYILPQFLANMVTAGTNELPTSARILMGLANFIKTKWWLLAIVIAALIVVFKLLPKFLGEKAEAIDAFKLKIPIFGKLSKKIVSSSFARTFATLMGTGVPLIQSLDITSEIVENKVVKRAIIESRDEIKKGESISKALGKRNIFPVMLVQMIKIGEESGTLDDVLNKTSDFYDSEVDTAIAQMTELIQPFIIIFLAFGVGFVVLAIMQSMFGMYEAYSNMINPFFINFINFII